MPASTAARVRWACSWPTAPCVICAPSSGGERSFVSFREENFHEHTCRARDETFPFAARGTDTTPLAVPAAGVALAAADGGPPEIRHRQAVGAGGASGVGAAALSRVRTACGRY